MQRLRSVTNDNGTHLDGLKSKRAKLSGTCNTLENFPIFKSELLQLVIDWQHAANQQLIIPSDTWSLGDTKQFIAEALSTVFEGKMEEWNNDPVNSGATVDTMIAKCVSLYKTGIRQNERKRKVAVSGSASFVSTTSEETHHQKYPRYDDPRQWYSNKYDHHPQQWQYQYGKGKGNGKGKGKGTKGKGKGKGLGGNGNGMTAHRLDLVQTKGKNKGKGSYHNWHDHGYQPAQSYDDDWAYSTTDDWAYRTDQSSGGDWSEWN